MRLVYRDFLVIICMLSPSSDSFILENVAKNQNLFSCSLYEIDHFEAANCTRTFVHTKQTGVVADHGVCTIKKYDETGLRKEDKICMQGAWDNPTRPGYPKGRRVRRFFGAFIAAFVLICALFCRRRQAPNRSPTITCPSIPSYYTAGPMETTVDVSWNQPTYSDPDGDSVTVTQNIKLSGSSYSKGQYTVSYVAKDRHGASDSCQFHFTIEVLTCEEPKWPLHGNRTCNHEGRIYGSTCTYTCNDGFVLSHNSSLECQQSEEYDHPPPKCNRIRCPALSQPEHGQLLCTNENLYESVCQTSCNADDGYEAAGQITTRCQADKSWTAQTACKDADGPSFTYCPPDIVADADRGQNSSTVTWKQPQAIDNHNSSDNITIDLVGGQLNGSRFEIGTHGQKYIAKDQKGNESPLCQFSVTVQELVCDSPDGIFNDTFIYTRCPSGFTFGSSCDVYCSDNYQLIGNVTTISCERDETAGKMQWQWGDEPEPSCNSDICADLSPPLNGALSCKKVGVNELCTMSCNIKYDIPRTVDVKDFFICSNDGEWTPSSVPDCTERKHPTQNVLPGSFYYFTGDCSDSSVQEQIKSNFVSIMNDQANLEICPPSDCSVEDAQVTCGETTKRRKRGVVQSHLLRRSTKFQIKLTFKIKLNWKSINGSTLEEKNQNDNLIMLVWDKLESTASKVAENVSGITFDSTEYGWTDAECNEGNKAVYSSSGVSCSGCPTGTMYNSTIDDCKVCPKGTYQDEAFQSSCKDCPEGTSTVNNGSRNETFCIQKCKPGYFSSNGFETCAPCPRGTYQSSTMSTNCQKCDALKTTISKGSIAKTDCLDFDVIFNSPEKTVEMGAIGKAIQDFTLGYWISCPTVSDSFPVFRLKKNGNTTLVIKASRSPLVSLLGKHVEVPSGRNGWNRLALSWISSSKTVRVYVDGIYNNHVLDVTETTVADAGAKLHIEQTSGDTADCAMSGFFFINKTLEDADLQGIISTCYPVVVGALYSMNDFVSLGTAGDFQVITPSKCDGFDDCKSSPCGAHRCQNHLNGYTCKCIKGYTGERCEVAPDYCLNNECQNRATCRTQTWNYTCDCSDGYRGMVCEEKIVDGNWTPWTSWGACAVTCGTSLQIRQRNCTNPPPDPEGKECIGNNQEQQLCATEECPQCPSSSTIRNSHNVLKCRSTGDFKSCEVSCRPGFVPLYTLKNPYYCGPNSSHVWAPERRAPACTLPKSPEQMQIQSTVTVPGLPCSSDSVTSINNNLKSLPCVNDSSCQTEVSLSGCDSSSRKRRSMSSTGVKVNFYVNLQSGDNLNLTSFLETGIMSDGLKSYIDALKSLEKTGQELNSTYENVFNVTVNGVTYELDVSSFSISGKLNCPNGTVPNDGSCVECGPGTKQVDNWCTWCSIGTYQDSFGQTECIDCPVGNTTEFMGSTNITECSEISESRNQTSSSSTTMVRFTSTTTAHTESTISTTASTTTSPSTTSTQSTATSSAATVPSESTTSSETTSTPTTSTQSTRTSSAATTQSESTSASATSSTPTTSTQSSVTSTAATTQLESTSASATTSIPSTSTQSTVKSSAATVTSESTIASATTSTPTTTSTKSATTELTPNFATTTSSRSSSTFTKSKPLPGYAIAVVVVGAFIAVPGVLTVVVWKIIRKQRPEELKLDDHEG